MLELVNIKKSYDGVTILNDMNLSIEKGEIVSILGPSGCGKTTLFKYDSGNYGTGQWNNALSGRRHYQSTYGKKRI